MLGFLTSVHLGKGIKPISDVAEPTRWTLRVLCAQQNYVKVEKLFTDLSVARRKTACIFTHPIPGRLNYSAL